jgi:dephospho-CoA kinase
MSHPRSLRIGLTGGLASGKSTVAGWLRDAGFLVVDADRVVAELYQPGAAGSAAVRDLFGPEFLNEQGGVDHARVAARVFGDPEARKALEKAIHPLVRQRFAEMAAQTEGIVVLEATLLVEAGYVPNFDLVITVECDGETRLRRAIARGMSQEAARARLLAQGDGEERRRAAHRRIDNCDDLPHLRRQVDDLIVELRRLTGSDRPEAD